MSSTTTFVTVTWSPAFSSSSNPVTSYNLQYSVNSVDWSSSINTGTHVTQYQINGLSPTTQYFFRIQAVFPASQFALNTHSCKNFFKLSGKLNLYKASLHCDEILEVLLLLQTGG